MTTFVDLGVPEALARVLSQQGITQAFPIQSKTLPDSLAGRDVLGRGRTGSGKTVAFALPLVARLAGLTPGAAKAARRPNRPTGLVLAPTRELATQIDRTVAPLAAAAGLNTTVIYGGVSQKHQERALAAGADIVVACPGRLEDLLKQGVLTLDDVQVTVIDEADHMADMGFLPVVTRILKQTPHAGQRLLFSATLDGGVDVLVKKFLESPVTHSVDAPKAAVSTMEHHVLVVDPDAKQALIETLASGTGRRVMFTRTKYRAKKMAKKLSQVGVPAVDLHGNLSQNARDRNLEAFSTGEVRVLVATDVAARGVHVDDVELVVHIDPPAEHKSYLHRSGRTARAGAEGQVITISTTEEQRDVQKLMKQAGVTAEVSQVTVDSPVVAELVGERAERVAYVPPAKQSNTGGQGSGRKPRQGMGKNSGQRSEQTRGSARSDRSARSGRSGGRGQGGRTAADGSRSGAPRGRGGQNGQGDSNGQNGRRGDGRGQNRDQNQSRHRTQGRNGQQSRSAGASAGQRRSDSAATAVNLHTTGSSAADRSTQAAARRRNRRAGATTGAPSGR
ncbi:DEAD/DEAH box helicase [Kocuria sp.]|uniref:DEAD/DEAH box helicase n=1 Tax=Kocuria sp. TaxID=1871328 RepID=UPI0026E0F38F|nr:DEAD/DEAH box helicase [Kocuria sp.]MDO5618594.1 DEAD/DEAH box helicase [Kocuria sp.]